MATHSRIGLLQKNGTVKSIEACHSGDLDCVGKTLLAYYKDRRKVKTMVSLGNVYYPHKILTKEIQTHLKQYVLKNPDLKPDVTSLEKYKRYGYNYIYLFKKGNWYVINTENEFTEFVLLEEAIELEKEQRMQRLIKYEAGVMLQQGWEAERVFNRLTLIEIIKHIFNKYFKGKKNDSILG